MQFSKEYGGKNFLFNIAKEIQEQEIWGGDKDFYNAQKTALEDCNKNSVCPSRSKWQTLRTRKLRLSKTD